MSYKEIVTLSGVMYHPIFIVVISLLTSLSTFSPLSHLGLWPLHFSHVAAAAAAAPVAAGHGLAAATAESALCRG